MDFEEKHDYLFDHLTALPCADTEYSMVEPICVTADPYTEQIYVLEGYHECLRVFIFSESGNILKQFSLKGLYSPLSIAIHQDNLYLTLSEKPFLVHFKVADELHLIRSREDIGSGLGNKFNKYKQFRKLAVSIDGDVFVTEFDRHLVQILDGDLNNKRQISHYSMINPCDVKLTADEVFVLSLNPLHSRYCILVFSQMGSKLRSIILHGLQKRIRSLGLFIIFHPAFCLDSDGNFIINDADPDEVKFFTKEGTLFQKLGEFGQDPGLFIYITGLTLTANHKLVVVSLFACFKVQIFSCLNFKI